MKPAFDPRWLTVAVIEAAENLSNNRRSGVSKKQWKLLWEVFHDALIDAGCINPLYLDGLSETDSINGMNVSINGMGIMVGMWHMKIMQTMADARLRQEAVERFVENERLKYHETT